MKCKRTCNKTETTLGRPENISGWHLRAFKIRPGLVCAHHSSSRGYAQLFTTPSTSWRLLLLFPPPERPHQTFPPGKFFIVFDKNFSVYCLKEHSLSKLYLSEHTTGSFTRAPHLPEGCETSKPESDWLSFTFLSPRWQRDLLYWCSPPTKNYTYCCSVPCVILSFEYGLNLLPTLTSRTWQNTSHQLQV